MCEGDSPSTIPSYNTMVALKSTGIQYDLIVNAIVDILYVVDQDLHITLYNAAFKSWLQELHIPEPVTGQHLFEIFPFLPEKVRDEYQSIFTTGTTLTTENTLSILGQEIITETRKIPIFEGDKVIQIMSLVRNITQRKRAEIAHQRYADRLRTLQDLDRAILGANSPEAVALAALSRIRQLIPCRRALVLEHNSAEEVSILAAEAGLDIALNLNTTARQEIFSTRAFRAHRIQGIEDLATVVERTPMQHALYMEGVQSYLLVPLVAQGELVGALYLDADHSYTFTTDYVDIANEVSSSLAVAIRQARLYQQTAQAAQIRAVLLEEINHRVKNNLLSVIGLLQAEQRQNTQIGPVCSDTIERLTRRIEGLAEVNRMLSAAEWARLPLNELATQIIRISMKATSPNFPITIDIPKAQVWVSPKEASALALIIHELVNNTIKHTLAAQKTAHITLYITQQPGETPAQDSRICLEYRDNGPGYPDDVLQLQHYNVGLHLIHRLVRFNLRGALTLANEGGAVTHIEFEKGAESDT